MMRNAATYQRVVNPLLHVPLAQVGTSGESLFSCSH
jgi:hypothetical protein